MHFRSFKNKYSIIVQITCLDFANFSNTQIINNWHRWNMAWVLELHFSFWEICNSIVCDQMLLKNSRGCIVVAIKKKTQKLRWYDNGYAMRLSWAELSMYCIFFIPEIANLLISVIETTSFSDSVEVLITLYSVHRLSFQSIKLCWLFRVYLVYFTLGEFWLCSKVNITCLDLWAQIREYLWNLQYI